MKIKLFLIAIFIGIWVVAQQKYVERDVEKIGGFRDASILLKSGESIHGKIRDQLYVGGYYIFKDNEGKKEKSKSLISKKHLLFTKILLKVIPEFYIIYVFIPTQTATNQFIRKLW